MPGILLCGAEGEQFLFENTLTTTGADDKRRGSVAVPNGSQMFRQFSTGYADFWVHARMALPTPGPNQHTLAVLTIFNGSTVLARITAVSGSNSPTVQLRFDGQDVGPTFPADDLEFVNYDIRIVVAAGNTTVSFYRNEVLRRTVTYASALLPDAVLFQHASPTSGGTLYVQDVIVTDALPTVGMELATLVPSAVGSYDDFTNDYTAIDDFGYDQSTTISTTALGDRESWFFSDPEFNLGDKVVYGIAMTTVAQTDLAGTVDDFEPFLRIGATNYAADELGANNIAPNAYTSVWKLNPATAAPWTVAEITGLDAGRHAV